MRRAPSIAALAFLASVSSACAPPKPTQPESTAVYDQPPAAAPAAVTRVSVNEPAGETVGSPAAAPPGPGAPPPTAPPAAPPTEPAAAPSVAPAAAPAAPAPAAPAPKP